MPLEASALIKTVGFGGLGLWSQEIRESQLTSINTQAGSHMGPCGLRDHTRVHGLVKIDELTSNLNPLRVGGSKRSLTTLTVAVLQLAGCEVTLLPMLHWGRLWMNRK